MLGLIDSQWGFLGSKPLEWVAAIIALWGGRIALRSYTSTSRATATAHMHALFRGYLDRKRETKIH